MGKDEFEIPDMGDLAKQMEEAMEEAQKAMGQAQEATKDLAGQLSGLEGALGALSGLGATLPDQLGDLGSAIGGFEQQHGENMESLAGDPDWELEAKITVGTKLEVGVAAELSLETVKQAWSSTQGAGFEALVGQTLVEEGVEVEDSEMGQIMEQLRKGRSVATIKSLEVLSCSLQGAPRDAKETLQLSPEANIPLTMDEGGLGLELAPLLTIRNRWENADLPTFVPMGQEIMVPFEQFEKGKAFDLRFEPKGQDDKMIVEISFRPLG